MRWASTPVTTPEPSGSTSWNLALRSVVNASASGPVPVARAQPCACMSPAQRHAPRQHLSQRTQRGSARHPGELVRGVRVSQVRVLDVKVACILPSRRHVGARTVSHTAPLEQGTVGLYTTTHREADHSVVAHADAEVAAGGAWARHADVRADRRQHALDLLREAAARGGGGGGRRCTWRVDGEMDDPP